MDRIEPDNLNGYYLSFSELAIYSASGEGGRALTTYPALTPCHDGGAAASLNLGS